MARYIEHVAELHDHWWWRPGWRPGRHFYACHFTFDDQPAVQALAATYQKELLGVTGLDLIPRSWLHLTMQGIGFLDQVTPVQVRDIAALAEHGLRGLDAPVVTFHKPVVQPEAIYLPTFPANQVVEVRDHVRGAIEHVLGADLDDGPEYRPHVSIAYSNTQQPAAGIVEALERAEVAPATVTLHHVDLLEFHRDQRMYEWTRATPIRIGAAVDRQ